MRSSAWEARDAARGRLGLLARIAASPFLLVAAIRAHRRGNRARQHLARREAYWRDLAYVLAAKLCGARVVYQYRRRPLAGLLEPLLRATLSWPDAVVVLSRCELDDVRGIVGDQNVALVPNAIDCAPFLRRSAPRAPGAPLRLVHIGRLVRPKGVFEMIEGLALARRQGVVAGW